jgi:hypothetical protein
MYTLFRQFVLQGKALLSTAPLVSTAITCFFSWCAVGYGRDLDAAGNWELQNGALPFSHLLVSFKVGYSALNPQHKHILFDISMSFYLSQYVYI